MIEIKDFEITLVGYTDPVGKPKLEVISRYSRVVKFPVVGQKWTLLTTFGLTREPINENNRLDSGMLEP